MSDSTEDNQSEDRGACLKCGSVEKRYKSVSHQENGLLVHLERIHLTGKRKEDKENKKKSLHKIQKRVSALRNTEGGVLLIHINGQREGDKYLEYFDEFIKNSFHQMLDHGHLYVNTYKRFWIGDIPDLKDIHDFVAVNIAKAEGVATVDFNTKLRSDHENTSPLACNISNILEERRCLNPLNSDTENTLFSVINHQHLQENRSVELKSFKSDPPTDVFSLINYIWEDLKFQHNLTALSKVEDGGYYFVGVSENPSKTVYVTKRPSFEGLEIKFTESEFREELQRKISASTIAFSQGTGFVETPIDLINIRFHLVPDSTPQRYVLELFVRYFEGIIFSDKKGPRAYKLEGNRIQQLSKEEWINRFPKRESQFLFHEKSKDTMFKN